MITRRDSANSPRAWDTLTQLGEAVRATRTLDELLGRMLDLLLEHTHTAAARVWLTTPTSQTLHFHFHRGLFPDSFASPLTISFQDSPAGQAAASRAAIHLDTLEEFPELAAKGFIELVSLPLIARGHVVGVLDMVARHRGELDDESIQLLETAAPMLALALDNANPGAVTTQREAELKRLWQAGLDVAGAADYAQTLRAVVDRARELIGAEASALCLWDELKQYWVLQGASGASEAFEVTTRPFPGRNGNLECPVVRFKYRQAHLDVPLTREGEVIGCLCIASAQPHEYSPAERELMEGLANQAALVIENARRMERAASRAVSSERERLAREMHDTLAQLLGFVNFKAQAAREYLTQADADRANKQLEQLISLTQQLYADTRELILGLRAVTTPQRSLATTLGEYCEHFSQLSDLPVELECSELVQVDFPPMVELQVLRVVQEALSNARKHARAQFVRVQGRCAGEWAVMTIRDDGQGFDPENLVYSGMPRFGLQSMRERMTSIGGRFRVESAPGRGTVITIEAPLIYRGAEQ